MKKSTFILVLLMVFAPLFVNAQTQNVEFGLQVGAGFFMGNENPANGYTRTHEFAWMRDSEGMPAFETFGGTVRYRFDNRWALQGQAMRQRTRFKESAENQDLYFYNSMWNVDLMAEFNILKYGFVENRNAKIYTITPYVATGIGTSLYNKTATYRWGMNDGEQNTPFPAVKAKDLAAALYIPFAAGLKVRMASNWQLKVACQYNLYVLNGNLDGSTVGAKYSDGKLVYTGGDGVSFENVKYKAASTHNVAVTVGVIYNLPANGQAGAIISY
ncbi:MAG: outer membrane beta-barrel protein [Paludibacteraceae bacterium]|nr:outer membrane beta-barrel protein [Paludibacteraceae bacterium]